MEDLFLKKYVGDKMCCNVSINSNSQIGLKRSNETRKKISESRHGTKLGEKHKESISAGLLLAYSTGNRIASYRNGLSNPFFGKKHSDKTKAILSLKRKGTQFADGNGRSKCVLDLETGIYYGSIHSASLSINAKPVNLRKSINRGYNKRFLKCC